MGDFLLGLHTRGRVVRGVRVRVQGYLAHKKPRPPYDFHRALGKVLL